jgi:hypothetical protein
MYVNKYTHKTISYIYTCLRKHFIYHYINKYVHKKIGFHMSRNLKLYRHTG